MHHSKGMLESSMGCSRIDHIGQSQLFNTPESLENRMIDNIALPLIQLNEAMNRITYFEGPAHLQLKQSLTRAY